jgi:hypothetical protein
MLFSSHLLFANIKNAQKDYCKMAYSMMDEFSNLVYEEYNLHLDGRGGAMMDNIKEINLSYSSEKYLDIDQTRDLIVSVIRKLVIFFNNSTDIQPFLHETPFSEKNIHLMISFEKNGKRINQNHVTLVSLRNSNICYYKIDKKTNNPIDVLVETYTEGLQKLAEEKH